MEQWGWLVLATVVLYLMAKLIALGPRPPRMLQTWASHAGTLFKRQGYLLVPAVIAGYVGVHAIMEARHERRANGALFERGTFMSMVSSGDRETFIAAMKTFGPVQTRPVPREPELLTPGSWWREDTPNAEPLRIWARHFLVQCTVEKCGNPQGHPRPSRINLRGAQLPGADLGGVDLRGADLSLANLRGAKLRTIISPPLVPKAGVQMLTRLPGHPDAIRVRLPDPEYQFTITMTSSGPALTSLNHREMTLLAGADLFWADLRDADLEGADLQWASLAVADLRGAKFTDALVTNADLTRADLRGADLRRAIELSQAQLDSACGDDATKIPNHLKPPPSCPE